MDEENLSFDFFNSCVSLSDAARKIFNDDHYRKCEKVKILAKEYGFDWHIWNERRKKKTKIKQCLNCGKDILVSTGWKNEKKFCSLSCSINYSNKKRGYKERMKNDTCSYCGNKIISKYKYGKYCSKECENKSKQDKFIKKWKSGEESGVRGKYGISERIRIYLFEKYNNQCQICGWDKVNPISGKIPLQIHHIDGDCTNNKEENLQLLCPNCHSLTETFGNLNKKSKRIFRRQKENI